MTPLVFVVAAVGVVVALVGMSLSLAIQGVVHALLALQLTLVEGEGTDD